MRALTLAAALLLFASPALAQEISGPARVIDGDTLDVARQRIRLHEPHSLGPTIPAL